MWSYAVYHVPVHRCWFSNWEARMNRLLFRISPARFQRYWRWRISRRIKADVAIYGRVRSHLDIIRDAQDQIKRGYETLAAEGVSERQWPIYFRVGD